MTSRRCRRSKRSTSSHRCRSSSASPHRSRHATDAWLAPDDKKMAGGGFIPYLNALLSFMPTVESRRTMMGASPRSASARAMPSTPANSTRPFARDRAGRCRRREGVEGQGAGDAASSKELFGSREELGKDYVMQRDSRRDARHLRQHQDRGRLRRPGRRVPTASRLMARSAGCCATPPGQLPPVTLFWSITMYNLPRAVAGR